MADINSSIGKLIKALNTRGYMLMYNKKQFMGTEGKPHNLYTVTQAKWDANRSRYGSTEVYKSTSTVRVVLFLRDLWFLEQGKELPMDNQMWNDIREKEKDKWAQPEPVAVD
jgi:hypothetical protein